LKIKAVVFDLDGTILDTKALIIEALIKTVERFKIKLKIENKKIGDYLYLNNMDSFLKAILKDEDLDNLNLFKKYYIDYYNKHCIGRACFYKGIDVLLNKLKYKFSLFIATSKYTICAKQELEHLSLASNFIEIYGTDFKTPHKPDPYILNLIANKYNLKAEEILMIGDIGTDILFGINFNTYTAAVTYGIWTKETFIAENIIPDYFIDKTDDLVKILFD